MLLKLPHLHDPGDTAAAARSAPGVLSERSLPVFCLHSCADLILRFPDHALKLPADSALAAIIQQSLVVLRLLIKAARPRYCRYIVSELLSLSGCDSCQGAAILLD